MLACCHTYNTLIPTDDDADDDNDDNNDDDDDDDDDELFLWNGWSTKCSALFPS